MAVPSRNQEDLTLYPLQLGCETKMFPQAPILPNSRKKSFLGLFQSCQVTVRKFNVSASPFLSVISSVASGLQGGTDWGMTSYSPHPMVRPTGCAAPLLPGHRAPQSPGPLMTLLCPNRVWNLLDVLAINRHEDSAHCNWPRDNDEYLSG